MTPYCSFIYRHGIYTHVGMSYFRCCHYYSSSFKYLGSLFTILVHSTFICFILLFYYENILYLLSCAIIMVNPYFLYRSVLIVYVKFSFVSNTFYTMIYNLCVCSLGIWNKSYMVYILINYFANDQKCENVTYMCTVIYLCHRFQ